MKEFMLYKFRETWEAQELAKKRTGWAIRNLFERVEKLEQESWNREGAVEDMGTGR